ncbi:nuclear transport factor 2 family protein [Flammeovirgaceae bacterium SG7u.111]|nr:nuclear transport factor 2 family protein [Flammeovirgaceae bacterium SG7u.132]WPO36087.1 nuclear transport factor 2 family protein [Flammeovirgaceae bacterium SG7u.111]
MENTNVNKSLISSFYAKVIGERDAEFAAQIVTDDYIQHNPMVKTGKTGFIESINFLKSLPQPQNQPKPFIRLIADGNFVAGHLEIDFMGKKMAVIDLFKIENDLIAEHWDAIENIPEGVEGLLKAGRLGNENPGSTQENKELVTRYLRVLQHKQFEQISEFVLGDFIQHSLQIPQGIEGLQDYYQQIDIDQTFRVLGEGNFVLVQSKMTIDKQAWAVYAIYRLEQAKIAEQWTVKQLIPEQMAHSNGMF